MTVRQSPIMDDDDLVIMRSVRRALSLLRPEPREAVVEWIKARYRSWPLIDRTGKVIDGAPGEEKPPPPLLGFIEQQTKEERGSAGDGQATAD